MSSEATPTEAGLATFAFDGTTVSTKRFKVSEEKISGLLAYSVQVRVIVCLPPAVCGFAGH